MARPDGGMFSIKLIHPKHLTLPYLTQEFDGTDGRWPLMNFSGEPRGKAIATNLPIGHRSLVYVIGDQKFVWAIEYTGTLEEGARAAAAHKITPNFITEKWNIYRPIHFLAKVDLAHAPTADEIFTKTGIRFAANAYTLKYISAGDYQKIYDAIDWQATAAQMIDQAEDRVLVNPFGHELSGAETMTEGAARTITVNAYERSAKGRRACIVHYGTSCHVCKLDFVKRYGEIGRGFIHVHHLRQLSTIGAEYEVDPIKDLRPVCPNCHGMLHRRNPQFSIQELVEIMREQIKGSRG
jgi:hypothetical protein